MDITSCNKSFKIQQIKCNFRKVFFKRLWSAIFEFAVGWKSFFFEKKCRICNFYQEIWYVTFFATVSNFWLVIIWKLSFSSNLFFLVCEKSNLLKTYNLKWKLANWKVLQDQIQGFNTKIFLQSRRLELGIILRRKRITEALRKKKVRFASSQPRKKNVVEHAS